MENFWIKPEKLFIIICMFWGLLFVLLSPPFTGGDECSHFWKIYLLSEGKISVKKFTSYVVLGIPREKVYVQTGEYVPLGMYKAGYKNIRTRWRALEKTNFDQTKEILSFPLEKHKQVFNSFPVPSYTIFSYLPSVMIMKIMTALNVNPGWMSYILRIVSLITYTALIYFSIKICPVKKWLFFALALLPTAIYQSSVINTDSIAIGTGFLFVAYTLYLAFDKNIKIITKNQIFLWILIALYFVVCKFAYCPMLLLFFLIPSNRFENTKQRFSAFLITSFISACIIFILFCLNRYFNSGTEGALASQIAVDLLVQKPVLFFKALTFTTLVELKAYLIGFVGKFGWGEVVVPFYCAVIYYYVLLSFALFNFKGELSGFMTRGDKFLCLFIFIFYYFLMFVVLYMVYHFFMNGTIGGMFGKYFIPIAPVLFLLFENKKLFTKSFVFVSINLVLINYILFVSLIRILYRFYV